METQAKQIVHLINDVLNNKDDAQKIENIKKQVNELCKNFPIQNISRAINALDNKKLINCC